MHCLFKKKYSWRNKMLNLNKKIFAFSFLIATTLFYGVKASANEQVLATIASDENDNTYQLVVDTNEDDRAIKTFYKDVFINGTKHSREALDSQLLIKNGMVLEQRKKYIVLKLKSDNFDNEQGGIVIVDTLYNGTNGKRKSYEIALTKDQTGWILTNHGKTVKDFFIESNRKMLIGVIGIKNLKMK
jgi:hypothetical protein